MVLLCRTLPPPVAGVLSIAASLTVLVLSSMLLLVVGGWTVWGVAALVTAATAVFTLVPSGMWRS
jgi:TRAP-type C4-dicarboxylate transport system permease small subunit